MIEQIIYYLAQNVAPGEIASMVGCSESYISQVKEREEYPLLFERAKTKIALEAEDQKRETRYSDMETKLITHIEEQMPFAEFRDLTKLMETLIKRKSASASQSAGMIVNNDNRVQTVILNVPQAAMPEIHLNSNREIIGVGSRSLAPMGSGGVRSIFQQIEEKKRVARAQDDMKTVKSDF